MSDDIELIIRRDLDRLPALPEERWVPKADLARSAFPALVVRTGVIAAAVLLALALGSALAYVRGQVIGSASASLQPTVPATTVVPSPAIVSRQSVLAYVRGLSVIVPRAVRFEAKLVPTWGLAGTPMWVVAVGGDVNCDFCVLPPPQPLHSALFWFDPYTGKVLGSSQSPANWPDGFELLPDDSLASGSRTLIGTVLSVNGDVVEFQEVGAADRLRLRVDENTAYAWGAGLVGGNAITLAELPPRWDLAVSVTFDPLARPDGNYRLEKLITGVNTR